MWDRKIVDTAHITHAFETIYWSACKLYAIKRSPMLASTVYKRELLDSIKICNGVLYEYAYRPYFTMSNLQDVWMKKVLFTYLHARQHVPLAYPKTFTDRYDVRYVHDDTGHTTVFYTPRQTLLGGETTDVVSRYTEYVQLNLQVKPQWPSTQTVHTYFLEEYSGFLNLLLRTLLAQMSQDTTKGMQRPYTVRTPDNIDTLTTSPATIKLQIPHTVYKRMQTTLNEYIGKCLYMDLCMLSHVPRYTFTLSSDTLTGDYTQLVTELFILRLLHAMLNGKIVIPSHILDHAEAEYLKPYKDLHDKECIVYNAQLRYRTYGQRNLSEAQYHDLVREEAHKLFYDFERLTQYYARSQPIIDSFVTEVVNSILHLREQCSIDINKKSGT